MIGENSDNISVTLSNCEFNLINSAILSAVNYTQNTVRKTKFIDTNYIANRGGNLLIDQCIIQNFVTISEQTDILTISDSIIYGNKNEFCVVLNDGSITKKTFRYWYSLTGHIIKN